MLVSANPPEKKTHGKTRFRSAESGGDEELLLSECRAEEKACTNVGRQRETLKRQRVENIKYARFM